MPPITVMVKPVSASCNMRCAYCFYADETARRGVASYGGMDEETQEALIRRVFAYADGGVTLVFQGGEPTLAGAGFYRRLLGLERKYNGRGLPVRHALQTNGYAVSDELLEVLREGRFLLGVSLDGCQEIHDSRRLDLNGQPTFQRVTDTIGRLGEAGIEYNILCVVDRQVARQAEKCYRALEAHRFLQFIPCLNGLGGETTEDSLSAEAFGAFLVQVFDLYEATLRAGRFISVRTLDNWVGMLWGRPPEACGMSGACALNYLVESNGNVYPCDFYALDQWLLGNIRERNFARLSKTEAAERFLASSRFRDEACAHCPWFGLCRGGCRRDREPFVNGQPGPNRLCAGYRHFFEARFDRLSALARWLAEKPETGRTTEE